MYKWRLNTHSAVVYFAAFRLAGKAESRRTSLPGLDGQRLLFGSSWSFSGWKCIYDEVYFHNWRCCIGAW